MLHCSDPFNAGDMELCPFEVSWVADGPFPTAEFSFYIPPSNLSMTLNYLVQNRNGLDVLLHPNSGCEIEDHMEWAFFAGTPWRLDTSAFTCEAPGCVPKS